MVETVTVKPWVWGDGFGVSGRGCAGGERVMTRWREKREGDGWWVNGKSKVLGSLGFQGFGVGGSRGSEQEEEETREAGEGGGLP